jgi:hypothetical protein
MMGRVLGDLTSPELADLVADRTALVPPIGSRETAWSP